MEKLTALLIATVLAFTACSGESTVSTVAPPSDPTTTTTTTVASNRCDEVIDEADNVVDELEPYAPIVMAHGDLPPEYWVLEGEWITLMVEGMSVPDCFDAEYISLIEVRIGDICRTYSYRHEPLESACSVFSDNQS